MSGTIAVASIVAKVRVDLVDGDAVTWSDDDLVEDLNEALRATCQVKLDTNVIRQPITLEAGDAQVLPTTSIAIFDILYNVNSGKRITLVDQEMLDEAARFAPDPGQKTDVAHWTADPRDKTRFRVYPPNNGTGQVLGVFAVVPDVVDIDGTLPIGDNNEPALVAYMLGAAYRRNTQRQDLVKSQGYTQQFLTMLGLSAQTQIAAAPKVSQSAGAN